MLKLGYQASFWHMRADDYGAALVQSKVYTVYHRKDLRGARSMLLKPEPMDLPVRAMSNLLLPVGIPRSAYCRDQERKVMGKSYLPCMVFNKAKHGPIFE
jgi:hypothetical protein